jgi:hypothetical protein
MSNVIDLTAFRKDRDVLDRLLEDEDVLDVFMVAFWHQSPLQELADSPQLRRRTRLALQEVVLYLRDSNERSPA